MRKPRVTIYQRKRDKFSDGPPGYGIRVGGVDVGSVSPRHADGWGPGRPVIGWFWSTMSMPDLGLEHRNTAPRAKDVSEEGAKAEALAFVRAAVDRMGSPLREKK